MQNIPTPECLVQYFVNNGDICSDIKQNIRYFDPKNIIGSDLDEGRNEYTKKKESNDYHLKPILSVVPKSIISTCQIVTWRGILTSIMCFPFIDQSESISFNAIFQNNVLYIENDKHCQLANMNDSPAVYWGRRFEKIALKSIVNDLSKYEYCYDVDWIHVLMFELKNLKILYGAEVDGLDENKMDLVELKTNKVIQNFKDEAFYETKLIKTWAQSYLACVPSIIIGMRHEKGILKQLHRLKTDSIPKRCKFQETCEPESMFQNLYSTLTKIRNFASEYPNVVFRVLMFESKLEKCKKIIIHQFKHRESFINSN